ncbi:hypothetical protein J6590_036278 [Homalodisca vitripennis]|nr:hypothetical protein J6590_099187 [Homalodisca vitripennis]KAG8292536.1 hypothetical protein J6590_036278 [Homalodisca vitripennis]
MSKRHRSKSPVSENTLISNLVPNGVDVISDDDLSDGYLENISSESEGELAEESDSELSVTYLHDIVEDPTFEPFENSSDEDVAQPGTSSGRPTVAMSNTKIDVTPLVNKVGL